MLGRATARTPQPGIATPVATPAAPSRDAHEGARLKVLHAAGGPVACIITAEAISHGPLAKVAGLVLAGFAVALVVRRPLRRHTDQLPLMRHLGSLVGAVFAGAFLVASDVTASGLWLAPAIGAMCAAAVCGSVLARRPLVRARKQGRAMRRVALIGSDRVAWALAEELEDAPERGYTLVGRIAVGAGEPGLVRELGRIEEAQAIIAEQAIDLLVVAPGTSPSLLDEVTHACLDLPVRMVDLAGFCERIFGHVPVTELNSSWFRFLMHPTFRRDDPPLKRVLDVVVAGTVAIVAAPVMAVLVALVRRDGGPALFTQTRIGAGGRPFTIYKLRTMRVDAAAASVWTTSDDPRVTRLGSVLRRTHLDELPQVLNVLRGDMSLVGPRPEQPSYVARLEREIPHYSRRHLIKPGITGWAQVRCGYAGTTEGSAWKMCHDLYYVKHRSVMLDLLILGETVRTLFADRQFPEGDAAISALLRAVSTPAA